MYADRFEQPRRFSPVGMAAAVAINAALVAGLIFANPQIIPNNPFKPFKLYPVTADPVPPPPPVETKPRPKAEHPNPLPAEPRVDTVDPRVPTPPSDPVTFDPGPPSAGGGGVTIDPVKPIAPPVLTGAEPDPRYARDFQPVYPPAERRAGHEGRVSVRVLVGVDGRVKEVVRISAASDDFFEAARRQAMTKWRFRPATRDGIPVEAWRVVNLRFVLEE